jgi:hypothetical protein
MKGTSVSVEEKTIFFAVSTVDACLIATILQLAVDLPPLHVLTRLFNSLQSTTMILPAYKQQPSEEEQLLLAEASGSSPPAFRDDPPSGMLIDFSDSSEVILGTRIPSFSTPSFDVTKVPVCLILFQQKVVLT